MGLFDDVPVVGGVEDAAGTAVTATLDVPADFINSATGTGENLGWFGVADRALDPRAVADDEWAEPTAENSGLSGFFDAGGGALGGLAGQTAGAASDIGGGASRGILKGLLENPIFAVILVAAGYLYLNTVTGGVMA
jgi:hypothetical protein